MPNGLPVSFDKYKMDNYHSGRGLSIAMEGYFNENTADDTSMYVTKSTSFTSAKVEDIPISESENGMTRKVIRAEIVEHPNDKKKSVKFALVHQRRSKNQDWEDLGGRTLAQLKAGEAAKIQLDTSETHRLFNHLQNLYQLGEHGIRLRSNGATGSQ